MPNTERIRKKAYELLPNDYVQNVAIEWLRKLEVDSVGLQMPESQELVREATITNNTNNTNNGQPIISSEERWFRTTIVQKKSRSDWPVTHNVAKRFGKELGLKRIRRSDETGLPHTIEKHVKTEKNKQGVESCRLLEA